MSKKPNPSAKAPAFMMNQAIYETCIKLVRNPLHEHAVTINELYAGMTIRRHNLRLGSWDCYDLEGFIVGEPYRYKKAPRAHALMLPVIQTNQTGLFVRTNWDMFELGIIPYEMPNGRLFGWNKCCYTLAVTP